jgi:hypothetical protein
MSLLSRFFLRKSRGRDVVTFDDRQIVRTLPDGRIESVRWDDLEEIAIITTDEGPYVDDIFWLLKGTSGGCAVPSEAEGMKELLPRLQELRGFDSKAVIEAMGSAGNATFVCWRRNDPL